MTDNGRHAERKEPEKEILKQDEEKRPMKMIKLTLTTDEALPVLLATDKIVTIDAFLFNYQEWGCRINTTGYCPTVFVRETYEQVCEMLGVDVITTKPKPVVDLRTEFDALIVQLIPVQQAEMILPIFEDKYPEDKAPRLAVESVEGRCFYAPPKKLLDDLRRSVSLAWSDACADLVCASFSDAARAEAAFVTAEIIGNVLGEEGHQQDAYHAFDRTTDKLKRKVIETGKEILKRDKKETPMK